MRGIYIDCETGGLDAKVHGLVSVGAVAFEIDVTNPDRAIILGDYLSHVQPVRELGYTEGAYAVHGISVDWLKKNGQPEETVYTELVGFIKSFLQPDEPFAGRLWAHNAPFDHSFVKALEDRVLYIAGDTMPCMTPVIHDRCDWSCTKNLWCVLRGLGIHNVRCKLDDIIDYYGIIDPRQGQHDAYTDAKLGIEVLRHMLFDLKKHYDMVK
ncbi:MAG: exonuclease domain-containing protein [Candidatus Izemoplasmatales bacterium]